MSTSSEIPFSKAHFEFDNLRGLTTPWRELHLSGVALGLIRLQRGTGYTFTHRHERQLAVRTDAGLRLEDVGMVDARHRDRRQRGRGGRLGTLRRD